jgi:hypothetical protein
MDISEDKPRKRVTQTTTVTLTDDAVMDALRAVVGAPSSARVMFDDGDVRFVEATIEWTHDVPPEHGA